MILQISRPDGTFYFDDLDYLEVRSAKFYIYLIERILGYKVVCKFKLKK